jgi:hypothetical protein
MVEVWTTSYLNKPTTFCRSSPSGLPHRIVVSSYELPFGKAESSNMGRMPDLAFGGWQLEGMVQGQSGQALGFGNRIFTGSSQHSTPRASAAPSWFSVNAEFNRINAQPASMLDVQHPHGVRGDGINNLPRPVQNFRVTKRQCQFRFENFNAESRQFENRTRTPPAPHIGSITAEKATASQLTIGFKVLF